MGWMNCIPIELLIAVVDVMILVYAVYIHCLPSAYITDAY